MTEAPDCNDYIPVLASIGGDDVKSKGVVDRRCERFPALKFVMMTNPRKF